MFNLYGIINEAVASSFGFANDFCLAFWGPWIVWQDSLMMSLVFESGFLIIVQWLLMALRTRSD